MTEVDQFVQRVDEIINVNTADCMIIKKIIICKQH